MIKQRLFERLWEEYSALGFDEAFLRGLAVSLASSDFVTDRNLEQVVADQKPYLERVQQSIDKRVLQAMRDSEDEPRGR